MLAVGGANARALGADDDAPVAWSQGPDLQLALEEPVDVFHSHETTREAIESLSQLMQVAVLLDRRVDPGQPLDFACRDLPLRQAYEQMAAKQKLAVVWFRDLAYFAPPAAAERLPALATATLDDVRRLPAAAQRPWIRKRALSWRDLATPRELIAQLAAEAEVECRGLERVPHDLWAAADLPPMTLADRFVLLAAQFDLGVAVTGPRTLELRPLSPAALGSAKSKVLAPDEAAHPASKAQATKRSSSAAAGRARPTGSDASDPFADARYTLEIADQPVGSLVEALAKRLDLELVIDRPALERAKIDLGKRVSFKVTTVTVDELLSAVLRDTGLRAERNGRRLEIQPAQ